MAKLKLKKYRCTRCGHVKEIQTNHYGAVRSWERSNCCPNCPFWAKYPEFGGSTVWECLETEPPPEEYTEEEHAENMIKLLEGENPCHNCPASEVLPV